jgi:hypothetical protein
MPSKIVLDNKRRATFGPEFEPGDSFLRQVNGDVVTFRKLRPAEAPLLRARKLGGKWMGAELMIDRKAIVEAIKRDRESR